MLRPYSAKEPFRFWCQKVLPLVYDDSLSYYEMLCKTIDYLNTMVTNVNSLGSAFNDLQDMVTNYFDNLDVQQEINNKLDEMVTDGTLNSLIEPLVGDAVSEWLEDNVTPTGSAVLVDSTLTISGAAADAKVTGDEISNFEYTADILKTGRKIIEQVQIDSSGVIITNQYRLYDLWCFQVVPGDVITNITISSGTYVYAFYTDEPITGSVSYNNSREVGSVASVDNVVVPAECNWIAVRTPANETVTITPESTVLSKINGKIAKALLSERTLVSGDSISAHPECANLDNLKINSVYTYTGLSLASVSGNLPFPRGFTIVTSNSLTNTYVGCYQCAYNLINGALAIRINAGSWSDWFYTNNVSFVVGANGDFTTLKECTEFIITNHVKNAKVLIKAATYDLVTEYTSDALESITEEAACGLVVGNNTHFIFEQNAKVVFNYTGNNTVVGEYFSPFNVAGDVTFENMIVECSNCRYCVHEDIPTITQNVPNASTIRYINCNMKNSGGAIAYEAPACIGAGTNKNTVSIIDGGVYDSSWTYDISYHNYNGATRGKIILKNVWMKNGLRLGIFSISPIDVLVSGCRMAKAIFNADSFDVKAWNNVIDN